MADLPPPNAFTYTGPVYSSQWVQTLSGNRTMVVVSADGLVSIDWKAVDATLSDPAADTATLAYARMLAAVRDGTWKPLEKSDH